MNFLKLFHEQILWLRYLVECFESWSSDGITQEVSLYSGRVINCDLRVRISNSELVGRSSVLSFHQGSRILRDYLGPRNEIVSRVIVRINAEVWSPCNQVRDSAITATWALVIVPKSFHIDQVSDLPLRRWLDLICVGVSTLVLMITTCVRLPIEFCSRAVVHEFWLMCIDESSIWIPHWWMRVMFCFAIWMIPKFHLQIFVDTTRWWMVRWILNTRLWFIPVRRQMNYLLEMLLPGEMGTVRDFSRGGGDARNNFYELPHLRVGSVHSVLSARWVGAGNVGFVARMIQ